MVSENKIKFLDRNKTIPYVQEPEIGQIYNIQAHLYDWDGHVLSLGLKMPLMVLSLGILGNQTAKWWKVWSFALGRPAYVANQCEIWYIINTDE